MLLLARRHETVWVEAVGVWIDVRVMEDRPATIRLPFKTCLKGKSQRERYAPGIADDDGACWNEITIILIVLAGHMWHTQGGDGVPSGPKQINDLPVME